MGRLDLPPDTTTLDCVGSLLPGPVGCSSCSQPCPRHCYSLGPVYSPTRLTLSSEVTPFVLMQISKLQQLQSLPLSEFVDVPVAPGGLQLSKLTKLTHLQSRIGLDDATIVALAGL